MFRNGPRQLSPRSRDLVGLALAGHLLRTIPDRPTAVREFLWTTRSHFEPVHPQIRSFFPDARRRARR